MAGPGQARFYSSTFVQTSLASGVSAGATSFNVGTTTGAPGTPFVVSVDQNAANEELMLVTNVSGLTYTVTRGVGGTAAVSHSTGAPVVHVMYAQDLTDAGAHIGAFDAVHGLSVGSLVVGTTDTQTLTNKTLTSPTLTTPSITSPAITGTTTAGTINSGALTSSAEVRAVDFKPTGLTGATNASRYVGANTSGAPSSGSFLVGDYIIDQQGLIWVCTVAGSPGTWISLVNISATQTLTNKTLSAPVLTGAATGSGSVSLSGTIASAAGLIAPYFSNNGITGATQHTAYAGGTTGGAPTSGTFSLGDFIIDDTGAVWICTSAGTPGTWASAGSSGFVGAGYNTNVVGSGANRTAAQPPFSYTSTKTITTTAGSGWSATFNDATFHGVGSFNVTPGNNTSNLGFLSVILANCSITAGALTLGGAAFLPNGTGVGTSVSITINVHVSAW